jgi:hypothetical protein
MKPPTEMPGSGAALQEFEPQRVDFSAAEASGRVGGVQAGFPLWLGIWTIGRIGSDRSDQWRAWLVGQRGQQRRFYGRDLARPYPKAHIAGFAGMTRAGGGAFSGSATSWSEAIDSNDDSRITLNGLPAGLILSIGDYIGYKWDAAGASAGTYHRRALQRVTVGGTASGAGIATVTAEPPLSIVVPGTAIAHLDRPACVMTLISDQTKLDAIDRRLAVRGGTVAGIQDLRP